MKKMTIMLLLVICSNVVLADIADFFIKFSRISVEETLKDFNEPPSVFQDYCKTTDALNEFQNKIEIDQNEDQIDESECEQRLLVNQKKCNAQFSSKKRLTSKKEIEALTNNYVNCVLDF